MSRGPRATSLARLGAAVVPRATPLARLGAAVVAFAVTASLAAGCGVPGSSKPIDRGAPAERGEMQTQQEPSAPKGPDSAASERELVELYLQAAAWGNMKGEDRPYTVDKAERLVHQFIVGGAGQQPWSAGNRDLILVRTTLGAPRDDGSGGTLIDATLVPVGVLNEYGSVDPTDSAKVSFQFRVVRVGGHFRLTGAPPGLYLDVAALDVWYQPQTIYFWSGSDSNAALVPDHRYLPTKITGNKIPNEVWRWLSKGPSSLIRDAVDPLPESITLKDNIVSQQRDGESFLAVNLTSEAAREGVKLQNLVDQLRWSLRASMAVPIELRIEGARKDIDGKSDHYLRRNPAAWPEDLNEPVKLVVGEGRVVSVSLNERAPQVFVANEDRDVVSAAVVHQPGDQPEGLLTAALVRRDGSGGYRLWIGRYTGSGDLALPQYRQTEAVGAAMSVPAWLARRFSEVEVLLAVDGELQAVSVSGRKRAVVLPAGTPRPITAVSVAPDGRRIALVAGGRAAIASLRTDGDALSLGALRSLDTGLHECRAIGWSGEDRVLVGGQPSGSSPLVELTVDGTRRSSLDRTNLGGMTIDRLVSYPDNPTSNSERRLAMIEANGQAYNVYGQEARRVVDEQVAALPGSTAGNSTRSSALTAPLFVQELS